MLRECIIITDKDLHLHSDDEVILWQGNPQDIKVFDIISKPVILLIGLFCIYNIGFRYFCCNRAFCIHIKTSQEYYLRSYE